MEEDSENFVVGGTEEECEQDDVARIGHKDLTEPVGPWERTCSIVLLEYVYITSITTCFDHIP
jgi:hypothetical protein